MAALVVNSDTPLSKGRANSHHTHSLGTPEEARGDIKQYRAQIADDMAHAAVLVDHEEFCNAYFPDPTNYSPNQSKPLLPDDGPFTEIPRSMGSEAKLRMKFAEIINQYNLIPGLAFRECSERPDPLYVDPTRQRVDAAWYFGRDVHDKSQQDWGNQVIPVEFKLVDDPFDDKKPDGRTSADRRKMARGQCITYSELLHAVQQRTALFMLVVIGRRVRFTRWDRSGTVVTRALDYVDNWRLFCDILWRIGCCSEAQLGFDPTATRVYDNDADYVTMFKASTMKDTVDHAERVLKDGKLPPGQFEYVRKMFKESLKDKWPRYRVKVPAGEGSRDFLVGKPVFQAKGMAGRGTRGYVALDCETGEFVWLKDAWRANYEFVEKEGDILAALNLAEVSYVPTLVCHGDIAGQATETPDWWERKNQAHGRSTPDSSATGSSRTFVNSSSSTSAKRPREDDEQTASEEQQCHTPLRLHTHYRLVVREVAMRLDCIETPQQLVRVVLDCIYAHWEAATKPETPFLHRDISSGNILIYPRCSPAGDDGVAVLTWTGLLADWEMSKPTHKGTGPRRARQPERTGTWQYLSVALLTPGDKVITIPDELESFFHVLLYYALRYVKTSNCDGESIADFLDCYFDLYGMEKGTYICGALKRSTMELGAIRVGSSTYPRFDNPLDNLFAKLLSWFRARYIVLAHEKNKPAASSQTTPKADTTPDLSDVLSAYHARGLNIRGKFGPSRDSSEKAAGPTKEDKNLAALLESHDEMLIAFDEAASGHWPKQQKAADQIPSGWRPPAGERFQQPLSKTVENKRKRIAMEVMSEPPIPRHLVTPRPPHTPPRRMANSLGVPPAEDDSP